MFISNINASIGFSLTALRLVGFWSPENMMGKQRILYNCYGFMWFMFLLGIYIIIANRVIRNLEINVQKLFYLPYFLCVKSLKLQLYFFLFTITSNENNFE
ncbi:unnamed protein product [Diatraea saccharalis]|uniref:Uncharacterized protein n=1 Tax=Diatraea saccharalis TaxID=40085 RepID=A0A9N9QZ55_9NEOP|nr:unnamed protein product [Diatraea saccharalis]